MVNISKGDTIDEVIQYEKNTKAKNTLTCECSMLSVLRFNIERRRKWQRKNKVKQVVIIGYK